MEEFNDKLQIYYKGKLIQIHDISNNPINYTSKHYEQTIKNAIKQEELETVVTTNLKIMDTLLESRTVYVSKEEAITSKEKLVAYLINHGSYSTYIKQFISSLNKEERIILFEEIRKLLPYIKDEEQFFMAFKHCVVKHDLRSLRMYFWIEDSLCNYDLLNEEGLNLIRNEFNEEIDQHSKEMMNQWR